MLKVYQLKTMWILHHLPQLDEQMQQALEEIEKSNMSDEQKDAMRQMMQSSMQMMDIYADVSESDKAAVLPFMSAIEASA